MEIPDLENGYDDLIDIAKSYIARSLSDMDGGYETGEIERLKLEMTRQSLEHYKAPPHLLYDDWRGIFADRKKQTATYFQRLYRAYASAGRELAYENEYVELWFWLVVQNEAEHYAPREDCRDGAANAKHQNDFQEFNRRVRELKAKYGKPLE